MKMVWTIFTFQEGIWIRIGNLPQTGWDHSISTKYLLFKVPYCNLGIKIISCSGSQISSDWSGMITETSAAVWGGDKIGNAYYPHFQRTAILPSQICVHPLNGCAIHPSLNQWLRLNPEGGITKHPLGLYVYKHSHLLFFFVPAHLQSIVSRAVSTLTCETR